MTVVKSFADSISPEELRQKGETLMQMVASIKALQEELAKRKLEIAPYVINQPLELPNGTVSYVKSSEGLTLNKKNLKSVLMQRLRISETGAEALLASASNKKIVDAYIKILLKKGKVPQIPATPVKPVGMSDINNMIDNFKKALSDIHTMAFSANNRTSFMPTEKTMETLEKYKRARKDVQDKLEYIRKNYLPTFGKASLQYAFYADDIKKLTNQLSSLNQIIDEIEENVVNAGIAKEVARANETSIKDAGTTVIDDTRDSASSSSEMINEKAMSDRLALADRPLQGELNQQLYDRLKMFLDMAKDEKLSTDKRSDANKKAEQIKEEITKYRPDSLEYLKNNNPELYSQIAIESVAKQKGEQAPKDIKAQTIEQAKTEAIDKTKEVAISTAKAVKPEQSNIVRTALNEAIKKIEDKHSKENKKDIDQIKAQISEDENNLKRATKEEDKSSYASKINDNKNKLNELSRIDDEHYTKMKDAYKNIISNPNDFNTLLLGASLVPDKGEKLVSTIQESKIKEAQDKLRSKGLDKTANSINSAMADYIKYSGDKVGIEQANEFISELASKVTSGDISDESIKELTQRGNEIKADLLAKASQAKKEASKTTAQKDVEAWEKRYNEADDRGKLSLIFNAASDKHIFSAIQPEKLVDDMLKVNKEKMDFGSNKRINDKLMDAIGKIRQGFMPSNMDDLINEYPKMASAYDTVSKNLPEEVSNRFDDTTKGIIARKIASNPDKDPTQIINEYVAKSKDKTGKVDANKINTINKRSVGESSVMDMEDQLKASKQALNEPAKLTKEQLAYHQSNVSTLPKQIVDTRDKNEGRYDIKQAESKLKTDTATLDKLKTEREKLVKQEAGGSKARVNTELRKRISDIDKQIKETEKNKSVSELTLKNEIGKAPDDVKTEYQAKYITPEKAGKASEYAESYFQQGKITKEQSDAIKKAAQDDPNSAYNMLREATKTITAPTEETRVPASESMKQVHKQNLSNLLAEGKISKADYNTAIQATEGAKTESDLNKIISSTQTTKEAYDVARAKEQRQELEQLAKAEAQKEQPQQVQQTTETVTQPTTTPAVSQENINSVRWMIAGIASEYNVQPQDASAWATKAQNALATGGMTQAQSVISEFESMAKQQKEAKDKQVSETQAGQSQEQQASQPMYSEAGTNRQANQDYDRDMIQPPASMQYASNGNAGTENSLAAHDMELRANGMSGQMGDCTTKNEAVLALNSQIDFATKGLEVAKAELSRVQEMGVDASTVKVFSNKVANINKSIQALKDKKARMF